MGITIMEREDPDLLTLLTALLSIKKEEIYHYHPLIGLIQILVEITDPINYAPNWVDAPFDGRARNVLVYNGFLDPYTPKATAAAMVTAGRIPIIENVEGFVDEEIEGLTLRDIGSFSRPAADTVTGPNGETASSGFLQYPEYGHFPIFNDEDAIKMYQEYLRSLAYDGGALLGYY